MRSSRHPAPCPKGIRPHHLLPLISGLDQFDIHRKPLLLEIPDGEFIGICQEMKDSVLDVIIFEMVHQVSSVTFDLWGGGAINISPRTVRHFRRSRIGKEGRKSDYRILGFCPHRQ